MNKRGYGDSSIKTLEIIDGNVDVVIYNAKGTSFYFYRFSPEEVFGEDHGITKTTNYLYRKDVERYLARRGREYDGTINQLLSDAIDIGMEQRYEM